MWLGLLFVAVGVGAQLPESAQPPEPPEQPGDQRSTVVEADSSASRAPGQAGVDRPAATPRASPSAATPTIELERLRNELRSEILEYRGKFIDYVLWFFGIVVTLAGFLAFRRFREIETEAKGSRDEAKDSRDEAKHSLDQIVKLREEAHEELTQISQIRQDLTAEIVEREPEQTDEELDRVRANPDSSMIDKAIANAITYQKEARTGEAIDLWRSIAQVAQTDAPDLAARAWFSSAFLLQEDDQDLRLVVANYDKAIQLKPDLAEAWPTRTEATPRATSAKRRRPSPTTTRPYSSNLTSLRPT
ncbi:MAG: hypothetical protein J4F98_15775 [Acidobacteria bacterium]|nr:hypothetical protein [Acidobacteriota bacterium]